MSGREQPTGVENLRFVVVGGGVAGLAAAHELRSAGVGVTVLEADRFGGKVRTSEFAGRPVDEGPDAFLARVPDATDLATEVGLGDRLVAPRTGRAHLAGSSRLIPLPTDQVLGIPADPDAPGIDAILDADGVAALRADLTAPGPPPGDGDESLGGFIRRRLGDQVAERLVGPLVGGINAGDIDDLSLAAVAPGIDALARSGGEPSLVGAAARALANRPASSGPLFLAPEGGLGSFVAALTSSLTSRGVVLRDRVPVQGIERRGSAWSVTVEDARQIGSATETTVAADGIVIATPAPVTARLLADHASFAADHLRAMRHASVAMVVLGFAADSITTPLDGSGFLVPRHEGLLCTAASFSSNKWAHLAPERGDGTTLVRVSAGRIDDDRPADLDDAELVEILAGELARITGIDGVPRASRVTRWPSSFPQYAPGHFDLVDAIEADVADRCGSISLAGSALRGVGIPAVIRSGRDAARRLLTTLAPR